MAYRIVETELAAQDLDSILSYLAVSLESPSAAASLADAVVHCYDTIEQMPLAYPCCNDSYLREMGYRKAVIHNYIMIYRVDDAEKTVYILRFFYGRRDYEKLI